MKLAMASKLASLVESRSTMLAMVAAFLDPRIKGCSLMGYQLNQVEALLESEMAATEPTAVQRPQVRSLVDDLFATAPASADCEIQRFKTCSTVPISSNP